MKKISTVLISSILAFGALLWFSSDAKAFLGMGEKAPQQQAAPTAPIHPIHDETTFLTGTKPWHLVPFADMNLEFEVLLPSDWQIEPDNNTEAPDLTKKIIAHIAKFGNQPTESYRTFLTVQALQLDHEIDAKSWLKYFLLSSGNAPEGEVTSPNLNRAYAGYVKVEDGVSTYTYMTVQISGNLAMVARFEIPLAYKDYMAFLQKRSVESFKLVYIKEETVEDQSVFTLVDALKFSYPSSWKLSNQDFKDLNKLSVQLHNKGVNDLLEGYIRFYAARRSSETSFTKETENVRKFFTGDMKLEFKKMVSSEDFNDLRRFPFGRKEVYRAGYSKGNLKEQEFTLVALADADFYIFVAMISPVEENNLYTWARNRRSFDLIVKSFK